MPPKWFNLHGFKMFLAAEPIVQLLDRETFVIGNNAAKVQIFPHIDQGMYRVHWRITFQDKDHVYGQIGMSRDVFKDAFGLCERQHPSDFSLEFEADTGIAGLYIRKGPFLNIPMPGTGMDGDPNISLFVSDVIKEAVRELINSGR